MFTPFVPLADASAVLALAVVALIAAALIHWFLKWARAFNSEPPAEPEPGRPATTAHNGRRRGWQIVALVVLGLLFGAWRAGEFDGALHGVGLNAKDCGTNAFGATFCGDDLDRYREQVVAPARKAATEMQDAAADELRDQSDYAEDELQYEDCLQQFGDPNSDTYAPTACTPLRP